jgi:ArsR family transcriptional regulator
MRLGHGEYTLVFKALSDETRLRVLLMLTGGELCACQILEHFQITQPTLSYHMSMLCASGLVTGRRDGAWMRYSLNHERITAVRELFDSILSSPELTGGEPACQCSDGSTTNCCE